MARSRRTPAMLVGRCSWELSGRKLQRKDKRITNSEWKPPNPHAAPLLSRPRPKGRKKQTWIILTKQRTYHRKLKTPTKTSSKISPEGTAETPSRTPKAHLSALFPQTPRSDPNLDPIRAHTPQAYLRRKSRAPNVTCNVWGVGLASKVCHFRKILQFSMNQAAQPTKTSETHLEPTSWVVYGLSTTCWGRHVASGERDH
jgi:hypothetical protein